MAAVAEGLLATGHPAGPGWSLRLIDIINLSSTVTTEGASIPALHAEAPGAVDDQALTLRSAPVRDAMGAVVGTVRFDTRRLSPGLASRELADSSRWTEAAARAYANAIGLAMAGPIRTELSAGMRAVTARDADS
ncbi:MAG: hypothetical protein HKP61_19990 [Dactylosporangium sp.]|nr:hypothetical protein [Dactylosporangium sp.]NNJ63166.1 hypothetical protein [Dactylosporangium sp.]